MLLIFHALAKIPPAAATEKKICADLIVKMEECLGNHHRD
jgi:hypothetical protein